MCGSRSSEIITTAEGLKWEEMEVRVEKMKL